MTNIAVAQRTTLSTVDSRPQPPEAASENRLKAALEHARRLTETVEDLLTALSSQLMRFPVVSCESAFNRYCFETPCALECRVYDC